MSGTKPSPGSDNFAAQAAAKREIEAALANPRIAEEGFETSKVIALIAVLLKDQKAGAASGGDSIPSRKRLVKLMKTCYQFNIKNDDGKEAIWYADMKKKGRIGKGKPPIKPDVTIWCSDRDLVGLAIGQANPQKLFAAGRIKIRGNIDRALKVEHILSHEREKIALAGQDSPSPADTFLQGAQDAARTTAPIASGGAKGRGGRWAGGGKAKL